MNGDVISAAQRLLEFHIFDPGLLLLNPERVAQVHHVLDGGDKLVVVVRRIVAKNVHVESGAFLDHRQTNTACADDGDGLAGDLVAEERQEWMP